MKNPDGGQQAVLKDGGATKFICAICGQQRPQRDLVSLEQLIPSLSERIRADHPDLAPNAVISRTEAARYRSLYVQELLRAERGELSELDRQVAESLGTNDTRIDTVDAAFEERRTLGERLSDHLANFGGSWSFILWFLGGMLVWIAFNQAAPDLQRFDPYPYILLNLILSCLAAIQAPIIMMSQKRQEMRDRLRAQNDYEVNLRAELEIRHLNEKIDHLTSRQWQRLCEIQQMQLEAMQDIVAAARGPEPSTKRRPPLPVSEARQLPGNRSSTRCAPP